MTTDMRYGIAIDAAQANTELQRIRTEVTTLAGQENALAKATDTATAALAKQGAAAAAASPKVETFQQRVAKLPDLLGKQAAAISLVSSSLEGMGGQVGKAVAGAGQIAAAFGAGGPFAAALVGGIAIIDKLTAYWKELNDEEDRNLKLKYAGVDAMSVRKRTLAEEVAALELQANPAKARADEIADIEKRIKAAESESKQLFAAVNFRVNENRENDRLKAKSLEDEAKLLKEKLRLLKQIDEAGKPKAPTTTSSTRAAATQMSPTIGGDYSTLPGADPLTSMLMAAQQHLTKVTEEEAAKRVAIRQAEIDAIDDDQLLAPARTVEDGDRTLTKIRGELAKEQAETQAQYAMQAATIIAASSQQLIADLISGQEHALERFVITNTAQAGQALVGNGIRLLGEAVVSTLTPGLQEFAPAQLAGGAGLIGIGVGLGGVAGGLGNLLGAESGGAARGASPRTSTGTTAAAAGPTQITYIFSPSRDEGAAAIALAGDTANRRQLTKTRTR